MFPQADDAGRQAARGTLTPNRFTCPLNVIHGKPIIGLTGGIGSGKSFVGRLFGDEGCLVIESDQQVARAYEREDVRSTIRQWWGDEVFDSAGRADRKAIARRVFNDSRQRRRLEELIFPIIGRERDDLMAAAATDPGVLAFVWDAPLLFEAALDRDCDAIVFVDAPLDLRLERVRRDRGWTREELVRREISQIPLDKKREMSDHTVLNTAGADSVRTQVRDVLSRILTDVREGPRR